MAGEIHIRIVRINSPLPTNQNFWSTADLSTSLSSPGVLANLPGLVFWREVQIVRYSSNETGCDNRQWWMGCVWLRCVRFITWELIWPTTYCLMMRLSVGSTQEQERAIYFPFHRPSWYEALQVSNFLLNCWMPRINTELVIYFSIVVLLCLAFVKDSLTFNKKRTSCTLLFK